MDRFNSNISFADIFRTSRNIAVVGLSPKPDRPSHGVALYLKEQGFKIIPVNPNLDGPVLGEPSYPDLLSVPYPIDIVDIFKRSEDIPPIVEQAIQVAPKVIWMQLGIINDDAAQVAYQAGIKVVMDRCTAIEYRKLMQVPKHPNSTIS